MHVRTGSFRSKLAKSVWLERERDAQRPPTAFIGKPSPGHAGDASFMEPVGMRTDPWKAFYGYSDDEATLERLPRTMATLASEMPPPICCPCDGSRFAREDRTLHPGCNNCVGLCSA